MSLIIDYTSGFFEATPSGETVGTDPATIGDPNFANVELLLHGDGTSGSTTFTDKSSNGLTITANGNAQVDTAVKKFGTGSIEFDGTGDYLIAGTGTPSYPNFGTGPFTIEMWIYNTASGLQGLWTTHRIGASGGMHFYIDTNNRLNHGSSGNGDNGNNPTSNNVISLNTWHHVALCKEGTGTNQTRIFVDGTQVSSHTDTSNYQTYTYGPFLGSFSPLGTPYYYNGYMDDVRISNVARYTSNFTPPTAAFSDQGPTISATTGNVFNHAPSADVAYTFSNPPTTGSAYDFTLKVTPSATVAITWPSSVKWAGGTAPITPASGETDVYTFYTDDGGTTYYGFQVGDALA